MVSWLALVIEGWFPPFIIVQAAMIRDCVQSHPHSVIIWFSCSLSLFPMHTHTHTQTQHHPLLPMKGCAGINWVSGVKALGWLALCAQPNIVIFPPRLVIKHLDYQWRLTPWTFFRKRNCQRQMKCAQIAMCKLYTFMVIFAVHRHVWPLRSSHLAFK